MLGGLTRAVIHKAWCLHVILNQFIVNWFKTVADFPCIMVLLGNSPIFEPFQADLDWGNRFVCLPVSGLTCI